MGWVPVPRVSAESLAQYEEIFGRHYYSFDHGPCHFVALNSLVVNSGLECETRQRRWVEENLARAGDEGRRLWMLMHYPPYVAAPDEPSGYDNVDEPGRSWLLGLFERHDVEAVFTGHVHHYFYNRYAGTDLYTVPATSFVRQDYGELFSVEPGDEEGGRNDTAKLGYCLVEVYEQGHVHRIVRSGGRTLAADAPGEPAPEEPPVARAVTRLADRRPVSVGAEMRQNWLSRGALGTNNSVSPFTRRWARNDWAVLALQEMEVSKVRVFLQELVKEDVLERLATLQEVGFEFLVYSYGIPGEWEYRLVREHRALLAGWELIMSLDQVRSVSRRLARIGAKGSERDRVPCYLSEVRDIRRGELDDANVKHEANYGFQAAERERIEELWRRDHIREAFDGFVFRLRRRGEPRITPWSAVREISEMGKAWGMRHQIHVLFSGNLTSDRLVDDLSTANRVAESAFAAAVAGDVDLYFDTFEDVDRGYFVRHGLVDRRYNPRLAARVLRRLHAALARRDSAGFEGSSETESAGARILTAGLGERFLGLALARGACTLRRIDGVGKAGCRGLRLLELGSEATSDVPVRSVGSALVLEEPVRLTGPVLLIGR